VVTPSRVQPIAPQRFALHFTVGQEAHDLLRAAQDLLGHAIPSGDLGEIFLRAMKLLVASEQKRKFAATERPRRTRRATKHARHIPAHVKRAVHERDGGRCTFVSASGVRCPACTRLEYDHVLEFARGGEATVDNLRLRCRVHNQYEAEQTYGAAFMEQKLEAARTAAVQRTELTTTPEAPSSETLAEAIARAKAAAAAECEDRDVAPWLRALGFDAGEVRRAVAFCATVHELTLEERVRVALAYLRPGATADKSCARTSEQPTSPSAAA